MHQTALVEHEPRGERPVQNAELIRQTGAAPARPAELERVRLANLADRGVVALVREAESECDGDDDRSENGDDQCGSYEAHQTPL